MRPRYLLLVDGAAEADLARIRSALASELGQLRSVGRLHLFTDRATPVVSLPRSEGFIVGTVFERTTGNAIDHLTPGADHAVTSTHGRLLAERYWGSYVAVWSDPARGVRLLRDPAGAIPAYWGEIADGQFVVSDAGLAQMAGLLRPEVAWQRLRTTLLHPDLPGLDTALVGLADTYPGTCHTLGHDRSTWLPIWKPADFEQDTPVIPSEAEQAVRLAQAIDSTVASWCSVSGSPSLELSGGLDSSIVAAALAQTGRSWNAVTFATNDADGDERLYARAVTERFGVALYEVDAIAASLAAAKPYQRLTARPTGLSFLGSIDRAMADASDALRAGAVFSGLGGDHIFNATRSTAPLLDRLARQGPRAAGQTAVDIARLCAVPLAEVYRDAARRAWTHRRSRIRPADNRYLTKDAKTAPPAHPWLQYSGRSGHGSRARTRSLVRILAALDGVDRMATHRIICPLLSQPVMETCLAVPSWQWVAGGRDRAIARAAYAGRLPALIVNRQGKGRLDSLLVGLFERQRKAARDLLLDGLLAGSGLLDRKALEQDLARPASDREPFQDRLMRLADAELWARAVTGIGATLPASR